MNFLFPPNFLLQSEPHPVVLSTRLRWARSLEGFELLKDLSVGKQEELASLLTKQVSSLGLVSSSEQVLLNERQIAYSGGLHEYVFVSPTADLSVHINHEDHLRLAQLLPAYAELADFTELQVLVEHFESLNDFQFDERGVRNSCVSNSGTGMRLSFLINIPAQVLAGKSSQLQQAAEASGLILRPMDGESSTRNAKYFFQISNQLKSGRDFVDIVQNLKEFLDFLIAEELYWRQVLADDKSCKLQDFISRSWWRLRTAQRLTEEEGIDALSGVFMGISEGYLDSKWASQLLPQLLLIREEHLRLGHGDAEDLDAMRASLLTKLLA